jgi:hypothetical protein
MGLKDKYAIGGIGYTPQGRIPGRTSLSFHLCCVSCGLRSGIGERSPLRGGGCGAGGGVSPGDEYRGLSAR